MLYFADLHVHSKWSRATSKDCNLTELARWAARKGLLVLATGDCTHPEWSREIRETLEEADNGLLRLKKDHVPPHDPIPGGFGPGDVRFMLNVEISSIYKKGGATRKVHNLVFLPDIGAMERFNHTLDNIGNIRSDGRPILGLDSKHVLEIALEASEDAFVVPAHIWTPWFSVLGSKSGFDSLEECFEDLSSHIFALETGLSSDPEMNHRLTDLDRYTLISNSDTHSPANLGREANIFCGTPGYKTIREALRRGSAIPQIRPDPESPLRSLGMEFAYKDWDCTGTGAPLQAESLEPNLGEDGFIGTVEFYPEEGKYHYDGHRKCRTRLDPDETNSLGGTCPVCGSKVTVGVMNRVAELADRDPGLTPEGAAPFWRMLPLAEILSEALGVGPKTKKVAALYTELVSGLGPEMLILWALPPEILAERAPEIVAEGILRARRGDVAIKAGYDGEYGSVQLFTPEERDRFAGQSSFLPSTSVPNPKPRARKRTSKRADTSVRRPKKPLIHKPQTTLNEEQQEAVRIMDVPVLVQAGPGTGKTRTLAHRTAVLINERGVAPHEITAVTFTRKAAAEMTARIAGVCSTEASDQCRVGTFHQLGMRILEHFRALDLTDTLDRILSEEDSEQLFRQAIKDARTDVPAASVPALQQTVSLMRQRLTAAESLNDTPYIQTVVRAYEDRKRRAGALDLDDLIELPVTLLREHPSEAQHLVEKDIHHLLVDELQDVNPAQYQLIRLLSRPDGAGLFVIGDPDQAIYGFRGSDRQCFFRFARDYPNTACIVLRRNYRSSDTILTAAASLLGNGAGAGLTAENGSGAPVRIVSLPGASTEGIFITRTIDAMLGGSAFFSMDSGRALGDGDKLSIGDFAVLYRLNAVGDSLEEAFQASGIPYQRAVKSKPEEEVEALDPRAEAVSLMTIHAAKGTEFPVVLVAGCEEGVLPYVPPDRTELSEEESEEERRLLYVAMTRAEKCLFLSHTTGRMIFGRKLPGKRSRFLDDADLSVCELEAPLAGTGRPRNKGPVQADLFSEG